MSKYIRFAVAVMVFCFIVAPVSAQGEGEVELCPPKETGIWTTHLVTLNRATLNTEPIMTGVFKLVEPIWVITAEDVDCYISNGQPVSVVGHVMLKDGTITEEVVMVIQLAGGEFALVYSENLTTFAAMVYVPAKVLVEALNLEAAIEEAVANASRGFPVE